MVNVYTLYIPFQDIKKIIPPFSLFNISLQLVAKGFYINLDILG